MTHCLFVIRDFEIREIKVTLERLQRRRPDGYDAIVVPGVGPTVRAGFVGEDVVFPEIDAATRVMALVDLPNANVGFEVGFALGRGKPIALAAARKGVADWLKAPPLAGFMVENGSSIGRIREILAIEKWKEPPAAPERGSDVLFLCSTDGMGEALHEEVKELRPRWRRLPSSGWSLDELPTVLAGVGTVVWAITPYPEGTDQRDGQDNAAASVVAGFAFAHEMRLHVVREENAREVADVKQIERPFASMGEFEALLEEIDPRIPPAPDTSDLITAYRRYLRVSHAQLSPFFQEVGNKTLDEVYIELDVTPAVEPGKRIDRRRSKAPSAEFGERSSNLSIRSLMECEALVKGLAAGRWVVLGDPGAGKSTLVRHLVWKLAHEDGGPVPVYCALPQYARDRKHPFTLAEESVRASLGDAQGAGLEAELRRVAKKPAALWSASCPQSNR